MAQGVLMTPFKVAEIRGKIFARVDGSGGLDGNGNFLSTSCSPSMYCS
jgi:hypothetical protein